MLDRLNKNVRPSKNVSRLKMLDRLKMLAVVVHSRIFQPVCIGTCQIAIKEMLHCDSIVTKELR